MLPLSTTRITVLRIDADDEFAEPYSGDDTADRSVFAEGVRAVIGRPTGREQVGGGEQSVSDLELACEPIPLLYTDLVRDESDKRLYRVVWAYTYPGEVTEAQLRIVDGDV